MILLAPNGKPSNLTPEQYKLVRTKAFKDWFGDWENDPENASKVIDSNGEPLVVYRSVYGDINNSYNKWQYFSPNKNYAKAWGNNLFSVFLKIINILDLEYYNKQIKTRKLACYQGMIPSYREGYLQMGNSGREDEGIISLYYLQAICMKREDENLGNQFMQELKNTDGLVGYEYGHYGDVLSYLVFNSNQIKLADGTNTTFDGNNPDIRFDGGGMLQKNKNRILSDLSNYESYDEWKRENKSDYIYSQKNYFLREVKKYYGLEHKGNAKYTFEDVLKDAKKYESYRDWSSKSRAIYDYSRINGWLNEIKKQLNYSSEAPKHTLETSIENAKNYNSFKEWRENNASQYQIAKINGWLPKIKDAIGYVKPDFLIKRTGKSNLTFESIIESVNDYDSYTEWRLKNESKYKRAIAKGWLEQIKQLFKDKIKDNYSDGGRVNVIDVKQYNIKDRNYRLVEIAEKKYNKIELYRQADDGNYYGELLYRGVPRYDAKFSSPMVNDINQLYAYEPVSNKELFNAVKNKKKPFASFGYWLSYYTEEEIQREIQSFIDECDKYDLEYAVEKISGENKNLERIQFQVCQKGTFDELFDIDALIEDYANNDFDSYDIEKIEEFRYVELSYFLNNEWDEHYALTGLILGIPPKFTMSLLNMWRSYGLRKKYDYTENIVVIKNNNTDIRFKNGGEITNYKEFFDKLKIENGSKYVGKKFGEVFPFLANKVSPVNFRNSVKQYNGILSRLEKNNYSTKSMKTADLNKLERIKKYIDKKKYLSRFYLDPKGNIISFDNSDNAYAKGGSVLLAPNGKPSNLTPEQYKLVRTKSFKDWFGDWENDPANASKVVDENGEPLVQYHFTYDKFTIFKNKESGFHFGDKSLEENLAILKGGQFNFKMNVFLSIKNPLRIEDRNRFYPINMVDYYLQEGIINPNEYDYLLSEFDKSINDDDAVNIQSDVLIKLMNKKGYDGFVYENKFDSQDSLISYLIDDDNLDIYIRNDEGVFVGKIIPIEKTYVKPFILWESHTGKVYAIEKDEGEILTESNKKRIKDIINSGGYFSVFRSPKTYTDVDLFLSDKKFLDSWIAFYPEQIKLADGTNNTFDGSNPDIRFMAGGDVNKFKELIEGYKLALEVEQDAKKIKKYQDIIEGYEIALELNANSKNDVIEKLVEDYDINDKAVNGFIDCADVHEVQIKNFDEKKATEIMNKYLKQYRIIVIQWSRSSCGYAYTKRNKEGYYRIKVPKPTDADRFGVVMHEIYHCIDSGFTKPSYLAEFKCDKFALDNLKEMNLDTSIWEKRMKWHVLSRVAMATNRGHKKVDALVRNFYPDIDFESWYGKKVFVGIKAPKGIGYKNPTYWDYIYIDID